MGLDNLWMATDADAGTLCGYAAVIFDMDGVITDTAGVHAAAWKSLFDELLPRFGDGQEPFDAEGDYRAFVDGRPREDGVRSFLASRGITLPEGSYGDGPEQLTGFRERPSDGALLGPDHDHRPSP